MRLHWIEHRKTVQVRFAVETFFLAVTVEQLRRAKPGSSIPYADEIDTGHPVWLNLDAKQAQSDPDPFYRGQTGIETRMSDFREPEPLLTRVLTLAAPPEREPLSDWAGQHRVLSSEASSSPGRWRTMPFQCEVLDCLSPGSQYEQVVLVWESSLGKLNDIHKKNVIAENRKLAAKNRSLSPVITELPKKK